MKVINKRFAPIFASAALLALAGCDVEQTREGELPGVDVDIEGGQLPEYEVVQTQEGEMPDVSVDGHSGQLPAYDIDTADVNLGSKEVEVEVPTVVMETETVTVPDVDVVMPEDSDDQ